MADGKLDVVVAFISTQLQRKRDSGILLLPNSENGLKKTSFIRISKLATIDNALALGRLGKVGQEIINLTNYDKFVGVDMTNFQNLSYLWATMKNEKLWTLCKIAIGFFIILTFTPLITPSNVYKPSLIGMPYTLWVGIVEVIILVGLTWLGTRVHPGREE